MTKLHKTPRPLWIAEETETMLRVILSLGISVCCMAALLYEIKLIDLLAVGLITHMRQSIIYMTHENIGRNNHSFAYAIRRKK